MKCPLFALLTSVSLLDCKILDQIKICSKSVQNFYLVFSDVSVATFTTFLDAFLASFAAMSIKLWELFLRKSTSFCNFKCSFLIFFYFQECEFSAQQLVHS